jgi:hypothetical protein
VSYIDKNSNIVISARMTNEGRKLLSLGLLTFDTFRLGDSEIDYRTLGPSYDITLENIMRAKAENPDLKTPLLPTVNATNSYLSIPTLSPVILETLTTAPRIGFFEYGSGSTIEYTAYTDTICHVLQADTVINLAGLTGGTNVPVSQAPTYGSNTYEPQVGDLMMVKMSNDELVTTQNQAVVELNTPVPYLWYKVQNIISGTLAGNDLVVEIDRNFASFPSYAGSNYCWTTFYPLGTGTTINGSNSNSLFSDGGFFSGGCVWNMNNVWTYPIPGVNPASYETFNDYGSESYVGSKEYFGYTSEIPLTQSANTACYLIPSVSIIHYTNKETCDNQSELKYGQKFYIDTTVPASPQLIMPTLMYHKNTGTTIGYTFSGSGFTEYVTLSGSNTTVYYTPLVDREGSSIGRIFPELQMFTIHNQELVAALSYKSNRNWTLPTLNTQLGSLIDGIIDGTNVLYLSYMLESTSGYTSGLHCQNIVCVTTTDCECNPTDFKTVNVTLPNQFPYMNVSGGTGWYADKFYVLAQLQPLGTDPDPTQWIIMDYTADIVGHTVGNRIDPNNLVTSVFEITNTDYTNGTTYNLNDFITIPQISESEKLQFGDERFFFGNVEAVGVTDKYRTKFVFTASPTMFNWSTNPSWPNSNQKVHISEVGIYDVNKKLVAIGKMNLPIEKVSNATIIIEVAFDL